METLICPNCNKTVTMAEEVAEIFCPYCGTKFAARQAPAPQPEPNRDEARNYIESAFRNGEYREMIACADEVLDKADDPVFRAYRAFAGIFDTIETYRVESREAYIKHAPKIGLGKLLTGKDAYSEHVIHEQFFHKVQEVSRALAQALSELDDGERELAQSLSARAVEKLFAGADPESEHHILFTLCVTDQNAVDLLPYLTAEALRNLYMGYVFGGRQYKLLPNQEKTAEAMRSELTRRGEPVPKESFGQKLKGLFAKNP